MSVTRRKECHCFTCNQDFHYLGIASHRAAHRRRKEYCMIEFSCGDIIAYHFHLPLSTTEVK